VENTETNRRDWRELLYTAPGLGDAISGCIMFEETLYQSTAAGKPFVDVLRGSGIVCGIKVDTGLQARPAEAHGAMCLLQLAPCAALHTEVLGIALGSMKTQSQWTCCKVRTRGPNAQGARRRCFRVPMVRPQRRAWTAWATAARRTTSRARALPSAPQPFAPWEVVMTGPWC